MLTVIIVEDDTVKYGRIHQALVQNGVDPADIVLAVCVTDALERLKLSSFDLMLLDVNLPRRLGDAPKRGGGLEVLHELIRDETYKRPHYIVGVTAFHDIMAEFGSAFEDQLWSLIHYSENSDRWGLQLGLKVSYIRALKSSEHFTDGITYGGDLAIVCALDTVEFEMVRQLPCDWQPLRIPYDETRYLSGSIQAGTSTFSVIAAAAPRMGMPASSVLAAKIIHQFRPRFIAMIGICAGRSEKVNVGDIIVADPTWDWGSGKISCVDEAPLFLPAPHQLDLDADVVSTLKDIASDEGLMARLKKAARGKKPDFELVAHFGPLASGAAVVAHKQTFDGLLDQHRGLLGIDMEAYGVATAAVGSGRPRPTALIIKGVCDYADKEKDDDYQEYAASVSAGFLFHAAQTLLSTIR